MGIWHFVRGLIFGYIICPRPRASDFSTGNFPSSGCCVSTTNLCRFYPHCRRRRRNVDGLFCLPCDRGSDQSLASGDKESFVGATKTSFPHHVSGCGSEKESGGESQGLWVRLIFFGWMGLRMRIDFVPILAISSICKFICTSICQYGISILRETTPAKRMKTEAKPKRKFAVPRQNPGPIARARSLQQTSETQSSSHLSVNPSSSGKSDAISVNRKRIRDGEIPASQPNQPVVQFSARNALGAKQTFQFGATRKGQFIDSHHNHLGQLPPWPMKWKSYWSKMVT